MLTAFDQSSARELKSACPDLPLKPSEPRYLEEPRGKFNGVGSFVACPRTTDQVAEICKFAAAHQFGVLPYGGGTGLVGGQIVPTGPEPLIVSLENMNSVREVYPDEFSLVAEAGVTIQNIQDTASELGLIFPLSYASKGTAQIGAGLAVNSGGLNVLRYGMARSLCLGVEAVLPDGAIHHGLKRLRKDNTGYDLRNLLIGSEGTLGIITAATLSLHPNPANVSTAFLAVKDPAAALTLLVQLREMAGEVVSAFELLAGNGLRFLQDTHPSTRQPFEAPPDWCVLVEIGTGASTDAQSVLEDLFSSGFAQGLILDGLIAASERQRDEFWSVREMLPEANRAVGAVASHDISLPLSEIPDFIETMEKKILAIDPKLRINAFGHLGDGNLHYNMFPPHRRNAREFSSIAPDLTRQVHDETVARGGSFSAEHGIGRLKPDDLSRYGDPAKLAAMRAIKAAIDPLGIMNPGAIFGG